MPGPRSDSAGARPSLPVAAAAHLPGAFRPPKTPVRDLGVRTASQVTPLTGPSRKRHKDALLQEQQQTPTRTPGRPVGTGLPTSPTVPTEPAASSVDAETSTPPTSTAHPTAGAPANRQDPALPKGQRQAAAEAASTPPRDTTTSASTSSRTARPAPADTRRARPESVPAGGRSVKQARKPLPKRLNDFRLLHSTNSAFDLASRGGIKDNRFFLQLSADHKARTTDYWVTRELINSFLNNQGSDARIATVDAVKSGLALSPTRTSKISDILQHAASIKALFKAEDVTQRKPAIIRVINNVPVRVSGDLVIGTEDEDTAFLQREIELALDAVLACPPRRMCSTDDVAALKTTSVWVAIDADYPDAARPRNIRLMQSWCSIRPFTSRASLPPCDNCWRFGHSSDACNHQPRCRHCNSVSHEVKDHKCDICEDEGVEKCVPTCSACGGPHTTGHAACPARPVFDDAVNSFIVPIGQRLHRIKQSAFKERSKVIRDLKAARESPMAS